MSIFKSFLNLFRKHKSDEEFVQKKINDKFYQELEECFVLLKPELNITQGEYGDVNDFEMFMNIGEEGLAFEVLYGLGEVNNASTDFWEKMLFISELVDFTNFQSMINKKLDKLI